jgi:hypothetical protein
MSKIENVAYVCAHVFDRSRPVLLVAHDEDGDWQFVCGEVHEGSIPRVVGIDHIIEHDPSLEALRDLPVGWEAERQSIGAPWIRTKHQADQ